MIVGNVLTCIPPEFLKQVLDIKEDLLKNYLQGLSLISNPGILLSILDTVKHFGNIDHAHALIKEESLFYKIEMAGGLDLMEEL